MQESFDPCKCLLVEFSNCPLASVGVSRSSALLCVNGNTSELLSMVTDATPQAVQLGISNPLMYEQPLYWIRLGLFWVIQVWTPELESDGVFSELWESHSWLRLGVCAVATGVHQNKNKPQKVRSCAAGKSASLCKYLLEITLLLQPNGDDWMNKLT